MSRVRRARNGGTRPFGGASKCVFNQPDDIGEHAVSLTAIRNNLMTEPTLRLSLRAAGLRPVMALTACAALTACSSPIGWAFWRDDAGARGPVAPTPNAVSEPAAAPAATNDLPTALRGLIDAHPRLQADAERQAGVRAGVGAAQGRLMPEVSLTTSVSRINGRDLYATNAGSRAERDETDAGVELRQPIYQGGQLLAQLRQARALSEAGAHRSAEVRQQVMLQAARAYLGLLRDQRIGQWRAANKGRVEAIVAATDARFKAGAATRTDLALAEAQLAFSDSELLRAMGETEAARAAYQRSFGATPIGLADPAPIDDRLPATLDEALAAARKASPRVLAAVGEARALGFAARAAAGGYLPSMDVRVSYSDGRDDYIPTRRGEETRVALRLTVPLVRAPAYAQARQAKSEAARARFEAEDVARGAEEEAASAYARHEAEKRRVAALSARVAAAERAVTGVRREFEAGTRTMQDLLSAEEQLAAAQIDREGAVFDRTFAAYTLLAAVGGFSGE